MSTLQHPAEQPSLKTFILLEETQTGGGGCEISCSECLGETTIELFSDSMEAQTDAPC